MSERNTITPNPEITVLKISEWQENYGQEIFEKAGFRHVDTKQAGRASYVKCIENMDGFRCFGMPLNILENELKKYGGIIDEIQEFYFKRSFEKK